MHCLQSVLHVSFAAAIREVRSAMGSDIEYRDMGKPSLLVEGQFST